MRSSSVLLALLLLVPALSTGVAADANRTAVVDRIHGSVAVVLVEANGTTAAQELRFVYELPPDARHEGAVLRRVRPGGAPPPPPGDTRPHHEVTRRHEGPAGTRRGRTRYRSDERATAARLRAARRRLDRLAEPLTPRPPGSHHLTP